MWTRRVAAPVAAVAVASLFAGGAQAVASGPTLHQAASGTLSVSAARSLANKLAAKQRKQRSLVFAEVGHAIRRSSARIDFPYRDRSTSDVLCTARIVVVQTGGSRKAEMRGASCHGIPSDMLAFESASRALAHDVTAAAPKVRKSERHYLHSLGKCDKVAVPRNRRKDVDRLVAAGGAYAFYAPLRERLGEFATTLHDVHAGDPGLVRGMEAWDKTLVLVDSLPAAAADPCGAVQEWSRHGFSSDSAPADFGELKVTLENLASEAKRLDQTVKHMLEGGVVKRAAKAFSPRGLQALVAR